MTLQSSLPYLAGVSALAATAASGPDRTAAERGLKSLAFAALAVFAYFRWISPTELAIALTLGAIGQALVPRRAGFVALVASWLVLADLFLQSGDGLRALTTSALRGGLFAGLVIGTVLGVRLLLKSPPAPAAALQAGAGALVLMGAAAITLDWGFWPAIAGAGAMLAGQAAGLFAETRPEQRRALIRRAAWLLTAAGQASVAYAFLK
jgi:hypothetical protein